MRAKGWAVGLLVAASCGGSAPGATGEVRAPTKKDAVASASAEPEIPCSPEGRTALTPAHQKALEELAGGKFSEAETSLGALLQQTPGDRVATVLLPAARTDANEVRRQASLQSNKLRPKSLPKVSPFGDPAPTGTLKLEAGPMPAPTPQFMAEKRASTFGHEVPPTVGDPLGDLSFNLAFTFGKSTVARYSDSVLVLGAADVGYRVVTLEPALIEAFPGANKPSNAVTVLPEVSFAVVVGEKLIAQISHRGGAAGEAPDGFVVAYDLRTDTPLWASSRGVGNVVGVGAATSTHYFTIFVNQANETVLQALDLATGKVVASQPLVPKPFEGPVSGLTIFRDQLVVEAMNVAFKIPSSPPPDPVWGSLTSGNEPVVPSLSGVGQCHLLNAAAALAVRDEVRLGSAIEGLPAASSSRKALQGAHEFLAARRRGKKGIDLSDATPKAGPPAGGPKVREVANLPPVKLRLFASKDVPREDSPFMKPAIMSHFEARADFYPSTFGPLSIYGATELSDATYVNYGNRYLVRVVDSEVKSILDLSSLQSEALAPDGMAVSNLFRVSDQLLALVGTATTSEGATASLVSFDPATGEVLWRTEANISNANVLFFQDFMVMVTMKGGKHFLALVRTADGRVLHTLETKQAPQELTFDHRGALYVGNYSERSYYYVK
jgi:hypothetical protein